VHGSRAGRQEAARYVPREVGVKKILKREKPKLFRKKAIEECEVYVYSLDQTEISDIEFGI
jgi:hypothetical protein